MKGDYVMEDSLITQARQCVGNSETGKRNWIRLIHAINFGKGYNGYAFVGDFLNKDTPVPIKDSLILLGICSRDHKDKKSFSSYYFLVWGQSGLKTTDVNVVVPNGKGTSWALPYADKITQLFNAIQSQSDINSIDPIDAVSKNIEVVYRDEAQIIVKLSGTPSDISSAITFLVGTGAISVFSNRAIHVNGDASLIASMIISAYEYIKTSYVITVNGQTVYSRSCA